MNGQKEEKKEPLTNLDIMGSIINVGIGAIMLNMFGGMMKMFGEGTPQKLAEEMMAGAVRGILDHFEYKVDEQKREIENLKEKLDEAEGQVEELQEELEVFRNPTSDEDKKKDKKKNG